MNDMIDTGYNLHQNEITERTAMICISAPSTFKLHILRILRNFRSILLQTCTMAMKSYSSSARLISRFYHNLKELTYFFEVKIS